MTVLVTGAGGTIGRSVTAALMQAGCDVATLSRRAQPGPGHHRADLIDRDATARVVGEVRPEAVIHLAGGAAPDLPALYARNVLTTVGLIEGCAAAAVAPYLVVVGSGAEYGESGEGVVAEDAPLAPVTAYGRAKVAQTQAAAFLANRHGLGLTVLRPFNIASPHMSPSTALGNMRAQLLDQDAAVRTVRCGRLDVVRDIVPASFVADVVVALARDPRAGETFNVCSGIGTELGAVLHGMARLLGIELALDQPAELLGIPAPRASVGDPGKLAAALGLRCEPTPASLAATMLAEA